MTEAYFAEYEAHEQVLTYLHSHLEGGFKGTHGVAIHKAIRKECEEVRPTLNCDQLVAALLLPPACSSFLCLVRIVSLAFLCVPTGIDTNGALLQVCADCLTQLARRAYQQHTLMPLAHTFMIFRAGYLYMKEEIKMLKIHGLMSVSCHDEIVALLDKRYAIPVAHTIGLPCRLYTSRPYICTVQSIIWLVPAPRQVSRHSGRVQQ